MTSIMTGGELGARTGLLDEYGSGGFYCEMFGREGKGLPHAAEILRRLNAVDVAGLRRRATAAERELYNLGITFTVYTQRDAIDPCLSLLRRESLCDPLAGRSGSTRLAAGPRH